MALATVGDPAPCKVSPGRRTDDDAEELAGLRLLAIKVFLALSALLIVADVLGRLFKDASFHADPVVLGLVFGTLLSLLGLEGIQRILDRDGK